MLVVVSWCGAYLHFQQFVEKQFVFFLLFLMSLNIRGERFWFLFQYQRAKNRARGPKIDPQIDTFSIVDVRDLTIFVVKNVVFLTFLRCWEKNHVFVFFSFKCLSTIRGKEFKFFPLTNKPKITACRSKWTQKLSFFAKLAPVFWPFVGWKKSSWGIFQRCFGVV